MKKLMALVLSVVCIMSFFMTASADTSHLSEGSYTVEYTTDESGKKSATVYIEAGMIDAFDYGIIYDPAKVTLVDANWTERFYEYKLDTENYTVVNVFNPTAVDDAGENTYVVFTGAIMSADKGYSVQFGEEPIAYATFTDIDEGDELAMVLGTATVNDVRNATVLGSVDLYKEVEMDNPSLSSLIVGANEEPQNESEKKAESQKTILIVLCAVVVVVAIAATFIVSKKKHVESADSEEYDDDEEEDED